MLILPPSFYHRSPLLVAPDLLGKVLVRHYHQHLISGRIVEVEAYLAHNDQAAHAYRGKTKRNASLYQSAGHAYVHRIHQQHCLDVVTEAEDIPSSVLIRALEPLQGIDAMRTHRHRHLLTDLTSGPGKLTQALQITSQLDGVDMTSPTSELYIEDDNFMVTNVTRSPRIGLSKATELDFRFYLKGNAYLSKV